MESGNPPTRQAIEDVYRRVSSAPGFESISFFPPVVERFDILPPDADLAPLIDHTLLAADATPEEIEVLCKEAQRFGFASVCVNPVYAGHASELLQGSTVKICVVVGFPLGAATSSAKAHEAAEAAASGADEIDMVMAIGRLKAGDYGYVRADIVGVVRAAEGLPVKVIIEACLLGDDEKIAACAIARVAGAAFVKTSTGFAADGATEHDVRLMRRAVGCDLGVKASGGIRDAEAARRMIAAGATRLGTSASVAIIRGGS